MTLIQINDTIINLDRVEKITFVPCGRHPGDERDSLAGPILYVEHTREVMARGRTDWRWTPPECLAELKDSMKKMTT